ncbi:MAG: 2OG-Fe(II) oxygenase [Allosphingosinicella sp.]
MWGGAGYHVDPRHRRATTALRERGDAPWLFERLDALFAEGGAALGLKVRPLAEPVQIVRYGAGDHFQAWHSDAGADLGDARLVSVSVELSDGRDYRGGTLEIIPDTVGRPRTLPRGGARFFPSRAIHRVVPVTAGTRWALVAWTGAA